MRWIDAEAQQRVPFDVQLALCRESAARWPHDAKMHARLGDVLLSLTKYDEAAEVFARARTLDVSGLRALELARCYLYLNRKDDALQICDQALASSPHPDISNFHELRGRALGSLHRPDDASDAFLAAMRTSPRAYSAASTLLVRLAHDPDDSRLLAFCEALPADYYNCSVTRGYRAVGLSRVGRVDEARKLVDLERHIWQVPFEPPQEFGGIENFNAMLAREILENPGLGRIGTYDFLRTQQLGLARERAYAAITVFMRAAFEKYLEDIPRRGLHEILPDVPAEGTLFTGANVVREGDRHLAHLHKYAYVSGVYHVSVPRDDGGGDDRAGALLVGPWSRTAGGHEPCWGRRYINPVVGVATIFPSHFFHSVVPTRGAEPRIAIAFDLNPIGRRSEEED